MGILQIVDIPQTETNLGWDAIIGASLEKTDDALVSFPVDAQYEGKGIGDDIAKSLRGIRNWNITTAEDC